MEHVVLCVAEYEGYSESDGIEVSGPPMYATDGSAAVDLRTMSCLSVPAGHTVVARTGVKVAMPPGMAAMVLSRSGLGLKGLIVAHSVGLIDSDYRGEIVVPLYNRSSSLIKVLEGDRIAQLMFVPYFRVKLEKVDELPVTERGEGGFGSTGGTAHG